MTETQAKTGIVLLSDIHGVIREIIRDNEHLLSDESLGRPFSLLVDRGSMAKTLSFLAEIRENEAAFNWEINLAHGDRYETLHFAGILFKEHLILLGAKTINGLSMIYEELLRINNEQTTLLRATLKEKIKLQRGNSEPSGGQYDEISRLNNELTTLQRELTLKNAELERLNALKNQFLGIAAHDLRSPLGIIMSYSNFLLEDIRESLSEEQLEFLTIIQSYSDYMLNLVNDLLDVAVIESGQIKLNLQLSDLRALAAHNVVLNNALAEKKSITISFKADDGEIQSLIDPARIEQVLNNLLSNAIKFSYEGGIIEVILSQTEDEVSITVRDHGQGIPAEHLDRIFQLLDKPVRWGTAGEKGTGLGLAIVRRIVEAHGGRVTVESEEGQGALFTVTLPSLERAMAKHG